MGKYIGNSSSKTSSDFRCGDHRPEWLGVFPWRPPLTHYNGKSAVLTELHPSLASFPSFSTLRNAEVCLRTLGGAFGCMDISMDVHLARSVSFYSS